MKVFWGIALIVILAGIGAYFYQPTLDPGAVEPPFKPLDPPTSTLIDPVEVFQKAFWKRPTIGDNILHAERREWADSAGVKRWEWFIEVEPSPELVKYLREDNAFSLVPVATVSSVSDSPTWFQFKPEDVETLAGPQGKMQLFFSKSKPRLYATDGGGGFQPGVPEAAPPRPSEKATNGRIPATSPPTSR
jgi:hypothetical protein